jgi:hypothetical protein
LEGTEEKSVTISERPLKPQRPVHPAAPRRHASAARRQVLRAFRDQVLSGEYRPPIDELSAELAGWLLNDGIPLSGSRSLRSPLPRNPD